MIVDIDIEKIKDFENHPFKVVMDESMKELLQSVTINGIINPLIVRKKEDYYEIISGHRRKYVAESLGIRRLPCIVKEMNDEEAVINMVDSNIQRENVLPSEKAFAYKMKLDAIKHQGRKIILTSNPLDWNLESAEIIGKENDESAATIRSSVSYEELRKYFPKGFSNEQIKHKIFTLLKQYYGRIMLDKEMKKIRDERRKIFE